MSLFDRLKCRLGLHVGNVECYGGGWAYFHCTRCGRLVSPAPPKVTQQLYDDEGLSEYGPLERENS